MRAFVWTLPLLLLACASPGDSLQNPPGAQTDRCEIARFAFQQDLQSRSSERYAIAHTVSAWSFLAALFVGPATWVGIPVSYLVVLGKDRQEERATYRQWQEEYCVEPAPFGPIQPEGEAPLAR